MTTTDLMVHKVAARTDELILLACKMASGLPEVSLEDIILHARIVVARDTGKSTVFWDDVPVIEFYAPGINTEQREPGEYFLTYRQTYRVLI